MQSAGEIFTVKQHGERFGLPGWWTVYRGIDPIHHWSTRFKAETYAHARECGTPHDVAVASAESASDPHPQAH